MEQEVFCLVFFSQDRGICGGMKYSVFEQTTTLLMLFRIQNPEQNTMVLDSILLERVQKKNEIASHTVVEMNVAPVHKY
jgi:F0F1-type ATP synthase gamma subunit